ncbi:hypothetical protein AURDEDRAFT_188868 [Auricularia subglabra TFB-10046 SS5]|nr:hypothetical protein AURDEDRAFT_188868 [Auricularia subglabra TFB-10046 SS5]
MLKRLLETDRISFLSGSSQASLRPAEILVNIKRRKTQQRAEFEERVKAVEDRLNARNFSLTGTFTLNGIQNHILLKADEHTLWETYATFALTPTLSLLRSYISALTPANNRWAQSGGKTRAFLGAERAVLGAPPEWVVLLLLPWEFLPPDELLWVTSSRDPTQPSPGRVVHTHPTDATYPYLLDGDTAALTQGAVVSTLRAPGSEVSLFAMIVNAYAKASAAVLRGGAHPDVVEYCESLRGAVECIMYTPPALDAEARGQSTEADPPASLARPPGGPSATSPPADPPEPSSAASDSPLAQPHVPDLGPPAEPPEPPLMDGLTLSETHTLLARSADGQLTSSERLDTMMLLLFGTGETRDSEGSEDSGEYSSYGGSDGDERE